MDTVIFTGHVPLEEYKKDRPREYQELVDSGNLDKVVVEKEITPVRLKTIKFFGYLFLASGIAIVILIIVILIAVLGFFLEYRAERAIEALKKMTSLTATVIRSGQKKEIDAKHLVPGDIICIETGDKVPADARLIEAFNLQAQEAALTGESRPVSKQTKELPEKTAVADMKNMVFSGTIIASGRANAVVAATGMQTEIGKIATMIEEVKPEPTPLQKKMDQLGKWIGKGT